MDPALTREQFSALIDDECRVLADLEQLLAREHDILVRNESPEALEAACGARQQRIGELLRIQEERRVLLRMLGQSPDNAGLEAVLRACGAGEPLRARWQACADAARRCRERNDRNGALVAARMKRVEGMLEILTGQRPGPRVYGPQGQVAAGPSSRLLAAEA
ncbi:MAG: flagellar protein FlgN [Steroidobacteraceae bacterium]|jgi:flagellar biosynthesis/type III secretory pathway chaperone|nr:flagellar protein FlgN [Steroidobacteraceae bacterium]